MSYASIETSEFSAEQSYLYLINGPDFVLTYTNAQASIDATIDGTDYTFSRPKGGIFHSEPSESPDPGRTGTTLTVSIGNTLVRKHREYPPHGDTTLVIYRQNEIDGTPTQVWSGTVFSPSIEDVSCEFECLTDFELMMRAEGLDHSFQGPCNNFLFQFPCPVNKANWRVGISVESIDTENFTVTVSGASGNAAGYFIAGHMEAANGDMRTIINDTVVGVNHILTLQQNFPSTTLRVGDAADAYPGCDRAQTTCTVKFGAETGTGAAFGGNPIQTNVNPHEIGRLQ